MLCRQTASAIVSAALSVIVISSLSLAAGASLGVVQSLQNLWEDVALNAAEAAIKAIKGNTGLELTLREVPLETLQVYAGRQHHIGIDVDGVNYEVVLGSEADLGRQALALPGAKEPTGLVQRSWWQQQQQHSMALPEVTLTGPLELIVPPGTPVSFYTPLAVDVGPVRRVQLAGGTTVRVTGLKSIMLRQAVDLPRLPGQYLAEVYAQAKLGEPEEGYHYAPGILYMSGELRKMAVNSSLPLLSFEVEPAAVSAGLSISSAGQRDGEAAPRLKLRKLKGGAVELSVRQGEVSAQSFSLAALTHVWAWPLPHVDMSSWVPYETMLRSLLASHPFDLTKVQRRGIALKLTKSSIHGVSLLAFEMEVRGQPETLEMEEGSPFQRHEHPLEVWEAVVKLKEKPGGGFTYVPLTVRRKQRYSNTLTMSPSAVAMALHGNSSVLPGFDSVDLGLARNAP